MIPGVLDRGRGGDDLGMCPVVPGDAQQPAEDQRRVGAEDPAVVVELVHHQVAQTGKEIAPFGVARQ